VEKKKEKLWEWWLESKRVGGVEKYLVNNENLRRKGWRVVERRRGGFSTGEGVGDKGEWSRWVQGEIWEKENIADGVCLSQLGEYLMGYQESKCLAKMGN